ncbi:flagellar hook-length control protein FliK [Alginatibacterium sediminis]|uniref:Flagellar hook-length control protein FliK n=1 Tax=Alginatibacterium sediminis TaxID=2164068 RepID=A0A420EFL5_9ALTE|nr:flagellar hook-length control protein FliK [Alginatibacterium sediminis]RKF19485.1 flagellar hook-length control protein FliK [Alginatibacterium sediminis]
MEFMLGQTSFTKTGPISSSLATDNKDYFLESSAVTATSLGTDAPLDETATDTKQVFAQALEKIALLVEDKSSKTSEQGSEQLQDVAALLADVKQQLQESEEHGAHENCERDESTLAESDIQNTEALLQQLEAIEDLVADLNQSQNNPQLEQRLSQLIAQDLSQMSFQSDPLSKASDKIAASEDNSDFGFKQSWLNELMGSSANAKTSSTTAQNSESIVSAPSLKNTDAEDESTQAKVVDKSAMASSSEAEPLKTELKFEHKPDATASSLQAKVNALVTLAKGDETEKTKSLSAEEAKNIAPKTEVDLTPTTKTKAEIEVNLGTKIQSESVAIDDAKAARELQSTRNPQPAQTVATVMGNEVKQSASTVGVSNSDAQPQQSKTVEMQLADEAKSTSQTSKSNSDAPDSKVVTSEPKSELNTSKNQNQTQETPDAKRVNAEQEALAAASNKPEVSWSATKADGETNPQQTGVQNRNERQDTVSNTSFGQSFGQSSDGQQQASQQQSQQQQSGQLNSNLHPSSETKEQGQWLQRPIPANNMNSELNERVQYMAAKGMQSAEIRLDPGDLGSLQIRLQITQEGASVQIQAQNPQTRELLEQTMPRLREMLSQQGIELNNGSVGSDQGRGHQHAHHGEAERGRAGMGNSSGQTETQSDIDQSNGVLQRQNERSVIDFYA